LMRWRWHGPRGFWIQVNEFPPLRVQRTRNGGWRMTNGYVVFRTLEWRAPSPNSSLSMSDAPLPDKRPGDPRDSDDEEDSDVDLHL